MNLLYTVTVLAFIASSLLVDQVSSEVEMEMELVFSRSAAPKGWTLGSRAAGSAPATFILAMKQQHLDVLESKFWSVSDPKSPEYQNFMSIEEINGIIRPNAEDVFLISHWLEQHGVFSSQIKSLGDALEVSISVQQAEQLFQTQFFHFNNPTTKQSVIRQFGSYSVPNAIRARVDFISGLSNFPPPQNGRYGRRQLHSKLRQIVPDNNDFAVVAQTIYNEYNIRAQTFGNGSSTSQGVIEFIGQTYNKEDLALYSNLTGIPIAPLPVEHIVGPEHDVSQLEATLDIQFISTVNIEATNWFWIEENQDWFYAFAVHFFNTEDVPLVISISYGLWEGAQCSWDAASCQQLNVSSDQYTARVNVEFQKIGLRGVTIVVASGDSGAHSGTDEQCTAPTLRAEFPGASPYVTSVGATQIINGIPLPSQPAICTQYSAKGCTGGGTEVAVSFDVAGFTSGGGFSEVSPQPAYQAAAVNNYLSSGVQLPPAAMYNASNRAHPDVSAIGYNGVIYMNGIMTDSGTSLSAPIAAAIFSLLNQASFAKSGKPLGFMNPLLYQMWTEMPSAFNDITAGDNVCTEEGCASTCKGWYATKGWDPVTGLGTLNYDAMLKYIQSETH